MPVTDTNFIVYFPFHNIRSRIDEHFSCSNRLFFIHMTMKRPVCEKVLQLIQFIKYGIASYVDQLDLHEKTSG